MKTAKSTEQEGDVIFEHEKQEGGQVAGWPLHKITAMRAIEGHACESIQISAYVQGRSIVRSKRNLVDLLELAESLRW